ncbi:hypothetical protein [Leptospira sp. id769339]|uniref:hypothetical protein n=1 Tax=Leptospira sp. id769339 TaxID=2864221 RepID=UPI00214C0A2F|nr:hypothetical protein [Leptospira sp. id769339]MCR1795587.1 hypothetical protein [Leptospira sp. id769339]
MEYSLPKDPELKEIITSVLLFDPVAIKAIKLSENVWDEILKVVRKNPTLTLQGIFKDVIRDSNEGVICKITKRINLILVRYSGIHVLRFPFQVFVSISTTSEDGSPITYICTLSEREPKHSPIN